MIVLFFLYITLALIITYILAFIMSTLKIEVNNVHIMAPKTEDSYINKDYKIKIKLCIGHLTLFKTNVTQKKLEKKSMQNRKEKIKNKLKNKQKDFIIEILKNLKKFKIKAEKLNININVGIEDAAVNAIIVGIISIAIFQIIRKVNNQTVTISPVYGKNLLKIDVESIIAIKMIHIIGIIYDLKKIRREDNGRTSNRKSYASSYE